VKEFIQGSYELQVAVTPEASQFSVGDGHGKFVVEEELETGP
jgi:hypothetical protein